MDELQSVNHTKWNATSKRGWMINHVHMLISMPPKSSVPQVVRYMKGKSAFHTLARVRGERKHNVVAQHLWAHGYLPSTVGHDETVIREYIWDQGKEDTVEVPPVSGPAQPL